MIISNARKDSTGTWTFGLDLTDNEVNFLVNLSIHSLLKVGMLSIQEQDFPQEIDILKTQNAPTSVIVN